MTTQTQDPGTEGLGTVRHGLSRRDMLKVGAAAGAVAAVGGVAAAPAAGAVPAPAAGAAVAPGLKRPHIRLWGGRRERLRDLGIIIGYGTPGEHNAITDVPGVEVGYKTLVRNHPDVVRTGITMINPRAGQNMWDNFCYSGYSQLNGNGEMTGIHWVREVGWLTSMIAITHTSQVGIVRDALVRYEAERNPNFAWRMPVVGETWDGFLNDVRSFAITTRDAYDAIDDLKSGPIDEGNVGGGTGMYFCGFKGGTGTASRVVPYHGKTYTVGVLVQTNYGRREDLMIGGIPMGPETPESVVPGPTPHKGRPDRRSGGSSIVIVATDAPMGPDQCRRLAERSKLGLGYAGCIGANGDGDLEFAFSNAIDIKGEGNTLGSPPDYLEERLISNGQFDAFSEATIESTMEAAYNSACMAKTMSGYQGTMYQMPLEYLVYLAKRYNLFPRAYR